MLYNEFVKGTGCKENEHNYNVYKELEIIYMNTDCTKEHIYEIGKKLVDNSKSEEELRIEAEVNAEIEMLKREISNYRDWIETDEESMRLWKSYDDKEMVKRYRNSIKFWKEEIRIRRNRIAALKWVLA